MNIPSTSKGEILSLLERSPCGYLLGFICNGKVCWAVLLLIPSILWIGALVLALFFKGVAQLTPYFWIPWGLYFLAVLISLYVLHGVVQEWGGPCNYCCNVDGRNFPCYGTRTTRLGGVDYTPVHSVMSLRGVGLYKNLAKGGGENNTSVAPPPTTANEGGGGGAENKV
jgi:hypothetical protein